MRRFFYFMFLTTLVFISTELNAQWVENIGGSDIDLGYDIAVDGSGNVYVFGYFKGTNADFDPGAGTAYLSSPSSSKWAAFLAKYDSDGNFIWVDGIKSDFDVYGYGLALDGTSNVFITGMYTGTADFDPGAGVHNITASGTSTYIAKYSASDGSFVWADVLTSTSVVSGRNLAVDGSGNVYATGYFQGTVDFDPSGSVHSVVGVSNYDIFIARYAASDGSLDWVNGMGSSGEDRGNGIAVDGSGNLFITGWIGGTVDFDPGAGTTNLTPEGFKDAYIAQYSTADGSLSWAKRLGGTSAAALAYNLTIDLNSNAYITGAFIGTISFDPNSSSGDVTAQGSNENIFLAKYASDGSYVWADGIGGSSGKGYGYDVAADASGNVFLTGYYQGTVDFDPGAGTNSKASNSSSEDIYIAGFNSAGSLDWVNTFGSSNSSEYGYGLFVSGSYLYFTGLFAGTIDFDPTGSINNLTASSYDAVFGKYNTFSGQLPVELTDFSISVIEDKVELKWQTATEVNNYGFEIERARLHPQNRDFAATAWTKIGFVAGAGNSNSPEEYSYVDNSKLDGKYQYRLKQIDIDGKYKYSDIVEVNINSELPEKFELSQNYPNPFNPSTVIRYSIPTVDAPSLAEGLQHVTLKIYDILGNEVKTLVNENQSAGNYEVIFNASNLSSGIYFYKLQTSSGFVSTKKLMLLK